jgi:hypothetical protein
MSSGRMCAKHKKTIRERTANITYGSMVPRSKAAAIAGDSATPGPTRAARYLHRLRALGPISVVRRGYRDARIVRHLTHEADTSMFEVPAGER